MPTYNIQPIQQDNTKVATKVILRSIPLTSEQQNNWKMFGQLNKPEQQQTQLSQGYKKTPYQKHQAEVRLAQLEKLENYQKQEKKNAENIQHAIEVAPYLIPGIGQAMWAGKAVDLATNKLSNDKYQSWGNMVDKTTGSGELLGDLTNPGYYVGAFPKLIGKGLQSTSKYALQKAEPYLMGDKRIPMMIGYKPKQEFWNPFKKGNKFTPNSESYYRVIGDEAGYNDLINSGVVRPNQSGIFAGRNTYYTKGAINDINNPVIGGGVKKGTAYKGDYIVEINKNDIHFPTQEHGLNKDWNFGITKAGNEIPYSSEHLNVYKRSGNNYIKLDKKEMPFQSEINWGNWNKEIPSNKPLMNEYLQIERTAKQNGTWMKNPDGSQFTGTPEQFVQQNSTNFKKSFPEGNGITYRGDYKHYPELDYNPIFTGDKETALNYTTGNASYWGPFHDSGSIAMAKGENVGGLHELYYRNNPELRVDAKNRDWAVLNVPEINKSKTITTDDIQDYIAKHQQAYLSSSGKSKLKNAIIDNVYDNSFKPGTVRILPHVNGNYIKSARGNNGMFDMTNPNIYKAIVPAVGLYGLTQSKKQGWKLIPRNKK